MNTYLNVFLVILLCLLAYLFGSIPFGLIFSKKFKNADIRTVHSGNIGATNVSRVLGFKLAFIVFLLDVLKGALFIAFVLILYFINADMFESLVQVKTKATLVYIYPLYGLSAVFGHLYPVYLGFQGGKGISSLFGFLLVAFPLVGLIYVLTFLTVFFLFKKLVSLASLLAVFFSFVALLLFRIFSPNLIYRQMSKNLLSYSLELAVVFLLSCLVILKHRINILKLIKGKEKGTNIFSNQVEKTPE